MHEIMICYVGLSLWYGTSSSCRCRRQPPDTENSIKNNEQAIMDRWQGVVFQPGGWTWG